MEAFDETYHVPGTHPEFMRFGNFVGWGRPQGKHSHIGYDAPKGLDENKAKLRLGAGADPRKSTAEMQVYTWEQVNTNTTKTLVDAAVRLVDELPEGTPADKVLKHWLDSARRDDAARGVIWPTVDPAACRQERHRLADFPEFSDRTRRQQHALLQRPALRLRPRQVHLRGRCTMSFIPKGKEPQTEWEYLPVDDPTMGQRAAAGLFQHGRRAAGHEERRFSADPCRTRSRRARSPACIATWPIHGHGRAAEAEVSGASTTGCVDSFPDLHLRVSTIKESRERTGLQALSHYVANCHYRERYSMKVNIGVFAHNSKDWERVQSGDFSRPPATPDYEFVQAGLALGDLAEPLGFDGIWAPEHQARLME